MRRCAVLCCAGDGGGRAWERSVGGRQWLRCPLCLVVARFVCSGCQVQRALVAVVSLRTRHAAAQCCSPVNGGASERDECCSPRIGPVVVLLLHPCCASACAAAAWAGRRVCKELSGDLVELERKQSNATSCSVGGCGQSIVSGRRGRTQADCSPKSTRNGEKRAFSVSMRHDDWRAQGRRVQGCKAL